MMPAFWTLGARVLTGSLSRCQSLTLSRSLISVECCTFKPLNLYMLIPYHCYLFDFVLFNYFQVLNKDTINSIDFGLKAHFEKT